MKKFIIFMMTVALVFGAISCDANKAVDADHTQTTVAKIGVSQAETKALTMTSNVDDATYTVVYKLTTTPKWSLNDKAIVGTFTNEVVKIKSATEKYLVKNDGSALYFSQGQWTIKIDCYYVVSGTEYLKFTGSKDVFFNNSVATASIVLGALPEDAGTGSLTFTNNIKVTNAGNTDSLTVSIDGVAVTGITSSTASNIITYVIPSQTGLKVGNHTILIQVTQNGTVVGGREFSFTLGKNEIVNIDGTIDASKYINGKIDMGEGSDIEELKITLAAQTGQSIANGAGTTVSAGVSSYTTGATLTYQWYMDSEIISSATSDTYSVPTTVVPGCYDFTCEITATKDGMSIKKSNNTRVTVNF